MESYRKKPLRGAIILLTATVVWGLSFVAQSKAMDYLAPLTYNGVRILLGGAALLPVVFVFRAFDPSHRRMAERERKARDRRSVYGGIVCGVFMCAAATMQQYGIAQTTVGKAGFVTALYIVLVPVFGVLFGKRVPWLAYVCVPVALIGFYFLCMKEDFAVGAGDGYVLLCAVLFAFQILFIDRFLERGVDGVLMACVQFCTAALLLLPLMFWLETPRWRDIWAARGTILYAGLLSGALGYTMQILGQRDVEPVAASLLMSLESVVAAVAGWLILGERFTARELLGCALVFSAVIASQLPVGRRKDR